MAKLRKIKEVFDIVMIPFKLVLLGLMVLGSYNYLSDVFKNTEISYGDSFHNLPENTIDVIGLGSSHLQYSFNPVFFYAETGLYAYGLGSGCQPYEVSYGYLEEALKTQSPKMVIMEVYTAMPLREICEGDGQFCYVLAQYEMTGQTKEDILSFLPEDVASEYRQDFNNYHNDWRTRTDYDALLPKKKEATIEGKPISPSFGYVYQTKGAAMPETWWRVYNPPTEKIAELEERDLMYLNKIYDLCKENDITLLLYKTPIDSMDDLNRTYLNAVFKWAEDHGVYYLDMLSRDYDYYINIHSDSFHANINGAAYITGILADKTKDIEFNHVQNDSLDELYKLNIGPYVTEVLKTEYDPVKYLRITSKAAGMMFIRATDGITDQRAKDILIAAGASPDMLNKEYYGLFKDGRLVAESTEYFEMNYDGHYFYADDFNMTVDGERYGSWSTMGMFYADPNFYNKYSKDIEGKWDMIWDYGYWPYCK